MPHAILLTRPLKDAEALAHQFEAQGFTCLIEPMLTIEYRTDCLPQLEVIFSEYVQVTIITSRHAVHVLAQCKKALSTPLIAVGKSSAEAATEYGFKNVISAEGNADSLFSAVKQHYAPHKSALFYGQGEHTHTDIAAMLSAQGFTVKTCELYTARATLDFSPALIKALEAESIDAVLFYSARTAQIYEDIASRHADLVKSHNHMIAICLSQNIAKTLHLLPWKKIHVDISNLPHYLEEKESIQNR